MEIELIPTITFILVTTFTPGPNNITSAAMGMLYGFRRTLKFLLGISTGFFFVMLASAWISASVLVLFPWLETWLRYIGAVYIIYLAVSTLKASYSFDEQTKALTYFNGLLLQVLNPKLLVYALALFTTFLAPLTHSPLSLLLAVVLLTVIGFCSISVWTLFGAVISGYLHRPRLRLAVKALLSLFLIYSAVELAGIL